MTASDRDDLGKTPTTPSSESEQAARAAVPTDHAADPVQDAPATSDPLVSTAGLLQTIMDLGKRKRFGNYEVVRLIGQGAMGNVFEVLNLSFDPPRREAMKVIRSRLRSVDEAVRRFKAEMARMANLQHPNIVAVFHADEEGGELFFTMPMEAGGDLNQSLDQRRQRKEGPLPATRAAELVRDVAAAVDTAHRHNVVHRDLKPSNILLREDGSPVVTDFGLAVLMSSSAGLSSTGSGPEGTPCYMPPEQAEARISAIGTWSDVYALGAILYELLTLRPPFKGSTAAETLRLVVAAPLDRPTVHNAEIPPALEAICLKCLDKDSRQRYATAGELAQSLKEFLEPARPKPMSLRRKVGIGLAVAALLVTLTVGGYAWRQAALRAEANAFIENGDRFRAEGHSRQALEQYAIALQRYDSMIDSPWPQFRSARLRLDRVRIQTRRGALLLSDRENADAKAALEASQVELEALRSVLSDDLECLTLLAEVYHILGQYHTNRDTSAAQREGLEFYEKSVRLRHEVCDRHPGQSQSERDLARGYGYMGDTLLELDLPERAKHAYNEAEKIRARLAASGEADAICLHARDFGNRSNFSDWTGNLPEAIAAGRERVKYYQANRLPDRLPGEYLAERAAAMVTVVDLELDRQGGPSGDVKSLLDAALADYRSFSATTGDAQTTRFQLDLAWINLVFGKYHSIRNEKSLAEASLSKAADLYRGLPSEKFTSSDHYARAQLFALLAKVQTDDGERTFNLKSAQTLLERAVEKGFKHIHRVERDRAFDDLRTTKTNWYRSKILEPIKRVRPSYKGE